MSQGLSLGRVRFCFSVYHRTTRRLREHHHSHTNRRSTTPPPGGDRPRVLGPRRPLHLPRHRGGVGGRLLRHGGTRATRWRAATAHPHSRGRGRFSSSRERSSSRLARRRSQPVLGDFVNVPRGTVHGFRNAGTATARMVLTFTPPQGMERFFEETPRARPERRHGGTGQRRRGGGAIRRGRSSARADVRLERPRRTCPRDCPWDTSVPPAARGERRDGVDDVLEPQSFVSQPVLDPRRPGVDH